MYDVNNKKSFDDAVGIIKSLNNSRDDCIITLIGNKIDIGNRIISKNDGLLIANEYKCYNYYDLSLKTHSTNNIVTELILHWYKEYEITLDKFQNTIKEIGKKNKIKTILDVVCVNEFKKGSYA